MAKKRMVSNQVVDSDAFLDMPLSAQALYLHLLVRADDEGFLNNYKKILRITRASDDDLKVLIGKNFVIMFESGVMVIKHWLIHNAIRKDRIIPTVHTEELRQLEVKDNNSYTLRGPKQEQLYIDVVDEKQPCQTSDGHMTDKTPAGVTLDKYRLDKNSIDKIRLDENSIEPKGMSGEPDPAHTPSTKSERIDYAYLLKYWNEHSGLKNIADITDRRKTFIQLRIKQTESMEPGGMKAIIQVINNCRLSPFMQGDNNRNWIATFDWVFGNPNNFIKVLEGNFIEDPKRPGNNNKDLMDRAARLEAQYGGSS